MSQAANKSGPESSSQPKSASDTGPIASNPVTSAATSSPGTPAQGAAKSGDATPTFAGDPSDEAVMNYLRKRGMGNAVLELTRILRDRHQKQAPTSGRSQLELDETVARNQRTLLSRTTGGGFGYDLDGAPSVAQWGVPDSLADGKGADSSQDQSEALSLSERMGRDEARAYVDSFTALQTWVLSLPDDPAGSNTNHNTASKEKTSTKDEIGISIASLVHNAAAGSEVPTDVLESAKKLEQASSSSWMPPSAKPELLAVSFALLVHTYCELLEVGMEPMAKRLLDVFYPVYESLYQEELSDLRKCSTTEEMIRLNSHNSVHIESLSTLKAIMLQVASFQAKKDELMQDTASNSQLAAAKQRKVAEYDQNIKILKQKHGEVSKRATAATDKTQNLPFLRRARAIRWQLTLSATSYGMLAAFLSSRELLLPISTLLQTKCEIHVERRDPLPYTPSCILDDMVPEKGSSVEQVRWAAPVPPASRLAVAGEPADGPSILGESARLPFPRYHLDEEYNSQSDADAAKRSVEFNRALLINGFRRLEALERKQEYEAGLSPTVDGGPKEEGNVAGNPLEPSVLLSTLCSSSSPGPTVLNTSSRPGTISTLWEESGVGITCAKMCPPDGRRVAAGCDDGAIRIWSIYDSTGKGASEEKPSTSGSFSPTGVSETATVLLGHKNGFPVFDIDWNRDGRTLLSAGGDGSVRLWDTMAVGPYGRLAKNLSNRNPAASIKPPSSDVDSSGMEVPGVRPESNVETSGAALAVYRGHASSSPVWSVAFAPSGFYFASAGSDGTARVWTTDRSAPIRILGGHTSPSVNHVTWHPNCNYVLTGSDDKTVRLWDVQSGQCVRLMSGCAKGINVIAACPSGRYMAAADHSGKISIWDLGSGKKVNELPSSRDSLAGSKRDLNGTAKWQSSQSMIHALSYSACGTALAAGGDDCVVRIWDVRGVAENMSNPEFASKQCWGGGLPVTSPRTLLHRPTVGESSRPGMKQPFKTFTTRHTLIMDLQYTKRNLLLSVGKYVAPMPVPITD